jgi:hypothetical protein
MGNIVTTTEDTPCLSRVRPPLTMSTPAKGGIEGDDSFSTYLYNETFRACRESMDWVGSWLASSRDLEFENRQLRRRINQLETEVEWSRMDAIESHYRNMEPPRLQEKNGATSISVLNLSSSDDENPSSKQWFIPHEQQVSGRGEVKLLMKVGIGSVEDQSTSLLVSAPDKENMLPRN